jgi:hypothetical protein
MPIESGKYQGKSASENEEELRLKETINQEEYDVARAE